MFKNVKAVDVDGITGETVKYICGLLIEWLCNLFKVCLKTVSVPGVLNNTVIFPLYRGKSECIKYREISLLNMSEKMFGRILIERVQEVTVRKN